MIVVLQQYYADRQSARQLCDVFAMLLILVRRFELHMFFLTDLTYRTHICSATLLVNRSSSSTLVPMPVLTNKYVQWPNSSKSRRSSCRTTEPCPSDSLDPDAHHAFCAT